MIFSENIFFATFVITNWCFLMIYVAILHLDYSRKVILSISLANLFILLYSNSVLLYFMPGINSELRLYIVRGAFGAAVISAVGIGYFTYTLVTIRNRFIKLFTYFFLLAWLLLFILSGTEYIVRDVVILDKGIVKTIYGGVKPLYSTIFILYGLFLISVYWSSVKRAKEDSEQALLFSMLIIITVTWLSICLTNLLLPEIIGNSRTSIAAPFLMFFMNVQIIATLYSRDLVTRIYQHLFKLPIASTDQAGD